jgi:predicted neuraminidase
VIRRILLSALIGLAAIGGELKVERVFGKETPTGPYKHPACLTELSNGDLYLAYYSGEGEYAVATGVYGARWRKSDGKWESPRRIAADPFRSSGNPVVWEAPDGRVWLFYVVRYGATWSSSRIQLKVSDDGAKTWSDSHMLEVQGMPSEGLMVRGRPVVLSTGDYLLPVYHEVGDDTESVGAGSTSRFLRYVVKEKRWQAAGVIRSAKGNIQPAVVEIAPGHLVAYCRRGGNYEPTKEGWAVRAESLDGGQTWTRGEDSRFPNPNSALDLIRLQNGHLLMVYNDNMNERKPLAVSLSRDGGRTWPVKRVAGDRLDTYAYPAALQARDGTIHIVFTSRGRTEIWHASLDEEWVEGK